MQVRIVRKRLCCEILSNSDYTIAIDKNKGNRSKCKDFNELG